MGNAQKPVVGDTGWSCVRGCSYFEKPEVTPIHVTEGAKIRDADSGAMVPFRPKVCALAAFEPKATLSPLLTPTEVRVGSLVGNRGTERGCATTAQGGSSLELG